MMNILSDLYNAIFWLLLPWWLYVLEHCMFQDMVKCAKLIVCPYYLCSANNSNVGDVYSWFWTAKNLNVIFVCPNTYNHYSICNDITSAGLISIQYLWPPVVHFIEVKWSQGIATLVKSIQSTQSTTAVAMPAVQHLWLSIVFVLGNSEYPHCIFRSHSAPGSSMILVVCTAYSVPMSPRHKRVNSCTVSLSRLLFTLSLEQVTGGVRGQWLVVWGWTATHWPLLEVASLGTATQ